MANMKQDYRLVKKTLELKKKPKQKLCTMGNG